MEKKPTSPTKLERSRIYITTSIGYVNGAPHIGHALEFVQADVYARYFRYLGHEVYFLTGTDEHGSKVFLKAKEEGKTPKELVDENSAKFKLLAEALHVSNDDFIRTTDKERHWPAVNKLWGLLDTAKLFEKRTYAGLYCNGCESFKTEKDIVDGKCTLHPTTEIQKISEENYFFLLSKLKDQVGKALKDTITILPVNRGHEILSLIKDGLHDVSFSRPKEALSWGIPVPNDPEQTMYVWCDALTNYISALGYAGNGELYQKYWANSEARKIHFIGKDILRFHAAIWPGMLIAAKLPLPTDIFVHGFVTVNGERMSKSTGNVVDPMDYVKEFGADALRYYLLREIPSYEDGDFNRERFIELYNGELANNLGNLAQRVVAMALKYEIAIDESNDLQPDIDIAWNQIQEYVEKFELHLAAQSLMKCLSSFNQYIDQNKPWELAKQDKEALTKVLSSLLNGMARISGITAIFLPETAKKLRVKLGLGEEGSEIVPIKPQVTPGLFMTKTSSKF